jgi:hypothetical protein
VKAAFPGHQVATVTEMGWRSLPDKRLLALANGVFDVLVTVDSGFQHEQNLTRLSLGVVLMIVPNNKLESYLPIFEELRSVADRVGAGELVIVATTRD